MQLLCPSLDYLDRVFADIQGGLPPEEPAVMVGTASVLDPSLAPERGHTLWLSSFAPYHRRDGRSWDDTREDFAERLLDRLSLYAPNIRDVIVASELTSPLDWHRRTGSIRGNPNHLDMTLDQILGYRPFQSYLPTAHQSRAYILRQRDPSRRWHERQSWLQYRPGHPARSGIGATLPGREGVNQKGQENG